MKILVRKLARSTTEKDLRVLFSQYGAVADCSLVLDNDTGLSKGFAFIEMPNLEEAKSAIAGMNYSTLDKCKIRVKPAED